MKNIFLLILVASSFATFSQSNFTVFNNGGQSFYVILNGIKQNSLPQTNVVVGGLKNSAYAVKLIFADGKTADIALQKTSYETFTASTILDYLSKASKFFNKSTT